ncbi:MAG: DNA polymerase I, partial [Rhodospirillaceae bacterium]|nr:DNA polymerase I [Rhodospirillaceae bacterium]
PAPASTIELPADPPCDHDAYESVIDLDALDRWIAAATAQGFVAFDTETDGLGAMARLVGISLATAPNKACYIPLGHGGNDLLSETPVQIPTDQALARLKPLFEDPAVLKIGHNAKYDISILGRQGVAVAPVDDTMVMSFNLDAGLHGHGMDELATTHLDHSCIAFKDVVGTGKSQKGFHEVPLREATRYAAEDADVTLRLWRRLKPRLSPEHVTRVYEMVDRPLVPVLSAMEREGIKVDREELARLSAEFSGQIVELEKEIHAIAGVPFT